VSVARREDIVEINPNIFDVVFLGDPFCYVKEDNPLSNPVVFEECIHYLLQKKIKIIVTTPICPTEKELEHTLQLIRIAVRNEVYGYEIHGFGLLEWMRENYPEAKVYFGSFANIYSSASAQIAKGLGVIGGTLSCELSLDEISLIFEETGLEIWLPIHGKFPIAFSRYCFFHSQKNFSLRQCQGFCNKETLISFDKKRSVLHRGHAIFSPKDLCLLEYLPGLIKKGFRCFRIEGYLLSATEMNIIGRIYNSCFQRVIRGDKPIDSQWVEHLKKISKYGFCNGFYFAKRGMDYIGSFTR